MIYAEIYGLPGASKQPSWQEIMFLNDKLKDVGGINGLADAPAECPPFIGEGATAPTCDDPEFPDDDNYRYDTERTQFNEAVDKRGDYDYDAYKVLGGRPPKKTRDKYIVDDDDDSDDDSDDDDESSGKKKRKKKMKRPTRPRSPIMDEFQPENKGVGILTPSLAGFLKKKKPQEEE